MSKYYKTPRMAQIARTIFPDSKKGLSFNQVQAIQLLTRTGDIYKFNVYCSSCNMSVEDILECQNEITVENLNLGEK